jgi:site-specific DNA recombinase
MKPGLTEYISFQMVFRKNWGVICCELPYQEELLSLDELRVRMPPLRQREQAMQAELQAINNQTADRAAYLKLAETLTVFLERLRTNAQTLDIGQRQRIMRLLVKEVIVGKDLITIKHSIPGYSAASGGNPQSSKSLVEHNMEQTDKSYLLCKGRDIADTGLCVPPLCAGWMV